MTVNHHTGVTNRFQMWRAWSAAGFDVEAILPPMTPHPPRKRAVTRGRARDVQRSKGTLGSRASFTRSALSPAAVTSHGPHGLELPGILPRFVNRVTKCSPAFPYVARLHSSTTRVAWQEACQTGLTTAGPVTIRSRSGCLAEGCVAEESAGSRVDNRTASPKTSMVVVSAPRGTRSLGRRSGWLLGLRFPGYRSMLRVRRVPPGRTRSAELGSRPAAPTVITGSIPRGKEEDPSLRLVGPGWAETNPRSGHPGRYSTRTGTAPVSVAGPFIMPACR